MSDKKTLDSHPSFRQVEGGQWEKLDQGEPTGLLYQEVETKPPPWVGNAASDDEKKAWQKEAELRLSRADDPNVEMFFALGQGLPDIVFVEPVKEEE